VGEAEITKVARTFEQALTIAAKAPLNSQHKQIESTHLPEGYSLNFIVRVSNDRIVAGDRSYRLLVISNNTCTPHSLVEYQ
jgi:hypothetical protein